MEHDDADTADCRAAPGSGRSRRTGCGRERAEGTKKDMIGGATRRL